MKHLILFSFLCVGALLFSQPYQVGHRQKSFIDASRNNRTITTEIYYPANVAGDNVAITSGQFPVLVFGHGFVMAWSAYDVVWNALVPTGYIMVFPTTETSFSPSHTEFAKDIAFLVDAMKNESLNSSSPFFNSNSGSSAVMGHSMGGGSAFLSVQYNTTINALATLAAANTNPSSINAASGVTIPSIVFSGVNDCVTPPAQHQIPMYDSLNSSCKTLVNIIGGSHCQFANYNVNCYFGEGTCSPQPSITPSTQQTTVKNLLLPWLDFYLKGSCTGGNQFQSLLSAANGITSQQNCTLVCNAITNQNPISELEVFPNPVAQTGTIKLQPTKDHQYSYDLVDLSGKPVAMKKLIYSSEVQVDFANLENGVYFLRVYEGQTLVLLKKWTVSR